MFTKNIERIIWAALLVGIVWGSHAVRTHIDTYNSYKLKANQANVDAQALQGEIEKLKAENAQAEQEITQLKTSTR